MTYFATKINVSVLSDGQTMETLFLHYKIFSAFVYSNVLLRIG